VARLAGHQRGEFLSSLPRRGGAGQGEGVDPPVSPDRALALLRNEMNLLRALMEKGSQP
jgi:hypothetical protein